MLQMDLNKKLKNQLFQFGLNPQEWSLERVSSTLFLVTHCQQKDLVFVGRCHFSSSKPRWRSLEVLFL